MRENLLWYVIGVLSGIFAAVLAIKYGPIGYAADRCPHVRSKATECADRMTAAGRACDEGTGYADWERETGLVCRNVTTTRILPAP